MITDPVYGPYYLPEVTIKAKKENPLFVPFKAFDKKFTKETGWYNLSPLERILSLLSVPQAFVTYHATGGKEVIPSKALGINNPVGSLITDMILDVPIGGRFNVGTKLGVKSIKGGMELLSKLKEGIYQDLLRKLPNMDARVYDLDRLKNLMQLMTRYEDVPKLVEVKPGRIPTISTRIFPIGLRMNSRRLMAEITMPSDILSSEDKLLAALSHELGHLYEDISSEAAHQWRTMGFSKEITDNLSKVLAANPAVSKMLSEKPLSSSLREKLVKGIKEDLDYLFKETEAYPFLTQTLTTLQNQSKLDISRLSKESFENLLWRHNPKFLSNNPAYGKRLLNLYSPKKISNTLYDFIQTHPVFPYLKK